MSKSQKKLSDIDRAQLILSGHCPYCLVAPGEEHEHGCKHESEESKLTYKLGEQLRKEIDEEILDALRKAARKSNKLVAPGRLR